MKKCLYILLLCFCMTTLPFVSYSEQRGKTTLSLDHDDDYLDAVAPTIADPIEGWNRAMHEVNDFTMSYIARPLSKGYTYVTPKFARTGISNFFHNLAFPARFVNNLLQGKGRAAGVEMSRFVLNPTVGLGGFINVAENHKPIVPVDDEDLGQTFAVWGMGEGFYIVWPILGPSTARDSLGMVGDYFLDPVTYVKPDGLAIAISASRIFNELDSVIDNYDDMKRMSVEPYSSVRDAYIQYRRAKIAK